MVEADTGQGLDGGDGAGRTGVQRAVDRAVATGGAAVAGVVAGRQVHHGVARDLDRLDPRLVLRQVGEHHRVAAVTAGVPVDVVLQVPRVGPQDQDVRPVRVVVHDLTGKYI